MKNNQKINAINSLPEDPFSGLNLQVLSQQLPRQAPRWCQLTVTLYSLVVLDTQRNPDIQSLQQFLEVIHWRAHGKITEDEFSVLFTEWMKLEKNSDTRSVTAGSNLSSKRKFFLNLSIFRIILLQKNYVESDLDLFIGIVLHETNLKLMNTTISYVAKNMGNKLMPSFNLEVVTRRWLELAEELFFSLDTPGYGSLRYDEVFFFCNCVHVGLQNWKNELELETDLSITAMTAITIQFIRDCGASLPFITSSGTNGNNNNNNLTNITKNSLYEFYDDYPKSNLKKSSSHSSLLNQKEIFKTEITLPMFKKLLVSKNIGENELILLSNHIKLCIEKIAKLARLSGADDLYFACQPYELKGQVIGSPRLFQEAVLFASGFQPPSPAGQTQSHSSGNNEMPGSNQPIPLILLFLLSDGEKYLSGVFRAIEFDVEGLGFGGEDRPHFLATTPSGTDNNHNVAATNIDYTNPLNSLISANEELHENANRIYTLFRLWSQNEMLLNSHGGPSNSQNKQQQNNIIRDVFYPTNINELLRDPTYQLIISTLLHYKRFQQIVNAGLYDFAINQFSASPVQHQQHQQQHRHHHQNNNNNAVVAPNQLSILCANLLPSPQQIFVEFGLSHPEINMMNRTENEGEDEAVEAVGGEEYPIPAMQLEDLEGEDGFPLPPPQSLAKSNHSSRRNSQLAASTNSAAATMNQSNQQSQQPNFLKPTQTFMAKAAARYRVDPMDSNEEEIGSGGGPQFNQTTNSDPEINKAKWQPLLDVRATTTTTTTIGAAAPPGILPPSAPLVSARIVSNEEKSNASSSYHKSHSNNAKNQHSSSDKEKKAKNMKGISQPSSSSASSSRNNNNLVLGEEEAQLFAKLLIATDPQEQNEILLQLRTKALQLTSPTTVDSKEGRRGGGGGEQGLLNSSNEIMSPLSVSPPRSPPTRHKTSNNQRPTENNKNIGQEIFPSTHTNNNTSNHIDSYMSSSSSAPPSSVSEKKKTIFGF
jgi:hypothetical protein